MNKLTGKRALVTGGGSGIGLAVARLFLEKGRRWPSPAGTRPSSAARPMN